MNLQVLVLGDQRVERTLGLDLVFGRIACHLGDLVEHIDRLVDMVNDLTLRCQQ